jgi:dolichyl-phosphate-mannose-protein mannosyltransferase
VKTAGHGATGSGGQRTRGPGRKPRAWLWIVGLLALWSLVTWATGGFFLSWHGLRVSARAPIRPLIVAVLVLAWALWRYGRAEVERDLDAIRFEVNLDRWAPPLALIISLVILAVGMTWTTRVAGGADSWSYVSQATLWAKGNLVVEQPIMTEVPWPKADLSFTPLLYAPAVGGGAIVSSVAPGYPMLMALFSVVHRDAMFWVVPLAGALLVGMSFLLGRALGGSAAGLLTCVLVATSPAFLFQLVAPMSDVVVAAFWVTALVTAIPNRKETWLGAGTVSALAILTRPNTAPIAVIFVIAAFWNWSDSRDPAGWRQRILKALAYGTGTIPGVLSVAAIHTALYGGPLQSGYGRAENIFTLANFAPNAVHYLTWLLDSETPLVCLAIAAPIFILDASKRWLMMMVTLCAVATWACYVFFLVLDAWWYLRYVLTALPCILALTAVTFTRLSARTPEAWRIPIAIAVLAGLITHRIDYAKDAGTFRSWQLERRYSDAGHLVNQRLERNAIVYSGQHSGSLRYYGDRLTVRWEAFDAAWFDRSVDILKEKGYRPYIVLDDWERKDFVAALGGKSRYGNLDWPPLAVIQNMPNVSIYDLDAAGRK